MFPKNPDVEQEDGELGKREADVVELLAYKDHDTEVGWGQTDLHEMFAQTKLNRINGKSVKCADEWLSLLAVAGAKCA